MQPGETGQAGSQSPLGLARFGVVLLGDGPFQGGTHIKTAVEKFCKGDDVAIKQLDSFAGHGARDSRFVQMEFIRQASACKGLEVLISMQDIFALENGNASDQEDKR